MTPFSGKRLADRKTYTQAVTLEFSMMDSGQICTVQREGAGVDISLTGIGLTTDHALVKGQVLKMSLPVDAMDVSMPVYSEVVWVRPENNAYRAGLRFLI